MRCTLSYIIGRIEKRVNANMFRVKCFSTRRLYAQIAMLASLLVVGGAASAATSATFEHDHGTVRPDFRWRDCGRGRNPRSRSSVPCEAGLESILAVARRCRFSTRVNWAGSTNFAHAKMGVAGPSTFLGP